MAGAREATATVDIKIRLREPLRADIEGGAKAKRISMNAEMVQRLSLTATELYGGPRTAAVLQHFANLTHLGGERDRWLDDYQHFQFVVDKWNVHLRGIAPPAPKEVNEYYESAKAAIEQLIAQPDPQLSLTMDLPVEKRIAQHRFTVRCVVDQAVHAGLDADRRDELQRLFADAERTLRHRFGLGSRPARLPRETSQ